MKKLPISLLLFSLIYLSSCTKEGPVGPAGPQGPTGPAGANGTTGPAGPAGSVIYTRSFTVAPSEWQFNTNNQVHFIDLSFPEITSTFLSEGGAVVAYRNTGTNVWSNMPNTFYPNLGSNLSWTYEIVYITVGTVRVRYIWSNSNSQQAPTSTQLFRIVAIGK
jgi:hypothetical protein